MKRREFITLLGGAAAWPLAAHAQQRDGVRRIAVLMDTEETNTDGQARIAAFRQGLQQLGWTEDRNIRIDLRWGGGNVERTRAYAAELVGLKPDVIFAYAVAQLAPLARETHEIPIVFCGASAPVADGFVASFARPGGNITGFTQYEPSMVGKWLGALKEIAPAVAPHRLSDRPRRAALRARGRGSIGPCRYGGSGGSNWSEADMRRPPAGFRSVVYDPLRISETWATPS
jgi:putative tryptophan/tyrosine transport system substrate-binding protein